MTFFKALKTIVGTHGLLGVSTIYVLSLLVSLSPDVYLNAEQKRTIYPLILFIIYHTECTPVEAVFCDDGLACRSGANGYTCGKTPTSAVVSVGRMRRKHEYVGVVNRGWPYCLSLHRPESV